MIKCVSNKKVYTTEQIAEDVLIETRTRFDYSSNHGPIAVYRCDDCGFYHLTSKGNMNPKLRENLNNGKIQKQKEAEDWLRKLKKK